MNWDEKARTEEERREGNMTEFPCFIDDLFTDGAQWQREQLRTDESIERMAVVIYEAEDPLANAGWAFESEDLKNTYREWAKDQITALLGED